MVSNQLQIHGFIQRPQLTIHLSTADNTGLTTLARIFSYSYGRRGV